MSNKRYSNKGVNSAAKAQAQAAAAQESKRQTLIICLVAIAVVILAVVLAIVLGNSGSSTADTTTTAQSTTAAPDPETYDLMESVKAEIDSLEVSDFVETARPSEYVKLTIQHYGEVVVRLRADIAPLTVQNFKDLVEKKFYDGTSIHRVVKNFMIQGGAPKDSSSSLTAIKGEFSSNGVKNNLSHIKGVISMARTSVMDSATSQFFICNADASASLDKNYAAFGYVVAGLDVVMTISETEVQMNDYGSEVSKPVSAITIEKVCFVNKK